jgi:hypothetical protein
MRVLIIFLLLFLVVFAGTETVSAQGPLSLVSVTNQNMAAGSNCDDPNAYRVVLEFNRNLTPVEETALIDALSYRIFQVLPPGVPPKDPAAAAALAIIEVKKVTPDCCEKNLLYLCPAKRLNATFEDQQGIRFQPYQYLVLVEDRSGKAFKSIVTKVLTTPVFSPQANQPTPGADKPASYAMRESESKEDSNIYISGELTGGHGTKPSYSTDVKIKVPIVLTKPPHPQPFFFFDLMASSNPKADPDSMDIGVEVSGFKKFHSDTSARAGNSATGAFVQPDGQICVTKTPSCQAGEKGRIISRFDWAAMGKIESDRDFDNTNFVGTGKITFPFFPVNMRSTRWTFKLFGGLDAGKNLQSPSVLAEGRGIFRPFAGASMFLGLMRRGKIFPFSFEGNYTQRWLLARELKLVENNNGIVTASFFSRRPRYFVDTKFTYQFNEFWGIYAGYQHGEKPPSYKLVDNSFKLGLVFKFKFKPLGED